MGTQKQRGCKGGGISYELTDVVPIKPYSGDMFDLVKRNDLDGLLRAVKYDDFEQKLTRVFRTFDLRAHNPVNDKRVFTPEGSCAWPIHIAAQLNHADAARILLEHGAKTNVQAWFGETPLGIASACNSIEVAQLLIEYGADINEGTKKSSTTPLLRSSTAEMAKMLIEHGADVNKGVSQMKLPGAKNIPETHKEMPLHHAVRQNWPDIVKLLIGRGAYINARGADGQTPIQIAEEQQTAQKSLPQDPDIAIGDMAEVINLLTEHRAAK